MSCMQSNYIGKTDCNIITRLNEPGTSNDQSMFQHLKSCEYFFYITIMMSFPDIKSKSHVLNLYQKILSKDKRCFESITRIPFT